MRAMTICLGQRGPDGMCDECWVQLHHAGAHCAMCGDTANPCPCALEDSDG